MSQMVSCAEILGRKEFKTHSEFMMMMFIAKVYKRLGYTMDCSMMEEHDVFGPQQRICFEWMEYNEIIYTGLPKPVVSPNKPDPFEFNMDAIFENEGMLFCDCDETSEHGACYLWSDDWAKQQARLYKSHSMDLYLLQNIQNIIMHLCAYAIVSMWEGRIPKKKIKLEFMGVIAKSATNYLDLISCQRTISWFNSMVDISVDFGSTNVDIDMTLHITNGMVSGRRKKWGVGDKRKQLDRLGFREGCIATIFERKGLAETNQIGKIVESKLVRVDKITDTYIAGKITPVYRTKEEVERGFLELPEESRASFRDMMQFKVNILNFNYDFADLAVDNYIIDERHFITLLDDFAVVPKLVTIDGKRVTVELNHIDAVYWLLCQYQVEFDRKLFKEMYSPNKELMWDHYGSNDIVYADR